MRRNISLFSPSGNAHIKSRIIDKNDGIRLKGFNVFFADGGEFKNFISLKDERIFDKVYRDKQKTSENVVHGLVVRVLRSELKQKLIQDGIIK